MANTKLSFIFIFLIFLLTGVSTAARSIELEKLIADARGAVGSERELGRIRSITAEADCVGPSGAYKTFLVSTDGEMTRFEQHYTYKRERSLIMVNGAAVWAVENGEPKISNAFARMAARGHEYQKMAYDFRKFFSGLELVGEAEFGGRRTMKVRAKNELGMDSFLYFDRADSRFAGYEIELPNAGGRVSNVFLGWKRVGKFNFPSVVRATDSKGDWTLRFGKIEVNRAGEPNFDVPPRIADMREILRLHEEQKTAHLTYNAELLVGDYPVQPTSLSRGNVSNQTREQALKRFKNYFSTFKFLEWEDIAPPQVKISRDGTLATKIVQKRVRGIYKDEQGKEVAEHVVYAWLEVLEKIDGRWRLVTIASTDKPGPK
jgi:hypothetical protein